MTVTSPPLSRLKKRFTSNGSNAWAWFLLIPSLLLVAAIIVYPRSWASR